MVLFFLNFSIIQLKKMCDHTGTIILFMEFIHTGQLNDIDELI
jgi:hypothetical protein